jgi:hypothetical protein
MRNIGMPENKHIIISNWQPFIFEQQPLARNNLYWLYLRAQNS